MLSEKIKELEIARAKVSALEKDVAATLGRELAELPARYGFADVRAFLRAVRAAAPGRSGRRAAKRAQVTTAKRKRAVITDDTRAELKKMVEAGKTGNEIAKELRISLPSVQNIKKALGLVKKR